MCQFCKEHYDQHTIAHINHILNHDDEGEQVARKVGAGEYRDVGDFEDNADAEEEDEEQQEEQGTGEV